MPRFPQAIVSAAWLAEQLKAGASNLRVFDCSVILDTTAGVKPYLVRSGHDGFLASRIPSSEFFDVCDYSKKGEEAGVDSQGRPLSFQMIEYAEFLGRLGKELGVSDDTHIVLYTQAKPLWATRVWWMLYAAGFKGVFSVLDGGLPQWVAEGRDVESGEPVPVAREECVLTQGHVPEKAFVGKEGVHQVVSAGSPLIHALPKPSFDGASDAYGRKGHITTATNIPFPALLSEESPFTFVTAEEAGKVFASHGYTEPPAEFTVYCGAGISATLPLFMALTRLHWEDTKLSLYDGSLSEWCADENCAMQH